jgi:hypothetical protein
LLKKCWQNLAKRSLELTAIGEILLIDTKRGLTNSILDFGLLGNQTNLNENRVPTTKSIASGATFRLGAKVAIPTNS